MLQNILNLEGVTVLNKKQQSTINGGASFTCYCGFVGGSGKQTPFPVTADTLSDALWAVGDFCDGQGATCSGN